MKRRIDNIYIKRRNYCNLYIIKGKTGDILIDTGFIGRKQVLKKWLDKFNVKLIILTHSHVDHTWNAAYIKKLYNCKIALSKTDIENLDNSKINSKPSNKYHRLWTKIMNLGMKLFVPNPFDIDMLLKDNQIIRKFGIELKIVSLPGHTTGSIGIMYKDYLFAGDALVKRNRKPQIAYQNQNNEDALNTYQKILTISPKLIFVGHDRMISLKELEQTI